LQHYRSKATGQEGMRQTQMAVQQLLGLELALVQQRVAA
jgi:hypothetical protein